jgi:FkbM family methyltransferase
MVNWSAIDPQSVPGRIVRFPSRLLPRSAAMHIRRGPARGMKWISGSSVHGCWLGTYELSKQKLLEQVVHTGMTVYDIGAQAGFYTLLLSRLVGESGQVIAFEPSVRELGYLIQHVQENKLSNVRIVQAAVGAQTGLAGFSTDRAPCQNRITNNEDQLLVPLVSLDSLPLPPPHVIKMDIEGGESDALKGASNLLKQHSPIMLIALHGEEHSNFCQDFLKKAGYRIFDLHDREIENNPRTDEIYARQYERGR